MIKEVIRPHSNEHGYQLKLKGYTKYFSVKKYGGVRQTYLLVSAIERELILKGYEDLSVNQINNTSGVSGFFIRFRKYSANPTAELTYNYKDSKGRLQAKTLSLKKYGLQGALDLAIKDRISSGLSAPKLPNLQESLLQKHPTLANYLTP